nr:aminoacyl--tRNA ligase-related protein [Klebsiella pneumoniae]
MSEALITESEPLTFTLPDGSLKLVRKGTTLQNVAESIDSSVAKNAVYAEIDGQYIDLIEAVQKSGTLNIITLFDEEALDPCTLEQLEGECKSILHLVLDIYKQFGFEEVEIKLSTRPEKRMGSDTDWDRLENALSASLEAQGLQWSVNPGEGAFYGPKLEFVLRDAIGRDWQCGTLQVDMNLPDRFDIGYIAEDGSTKRPVMLHRALFGSLERFTGILLEHYAGKLPAWLSPVQAVVMTITDKQHRYAEQVLKALRRKGLRCETDLRNEKIDEAIWRARFGDAIPPGEHAAIRSVDACLTSSRQAVSLAKKHRTRLHVLHITTADELVLFDAAPTLEALRQKTITAEACVHHLFFNYDDYETLGHKLKCNPSVKTSFHQEALWKGVNEGIIDVIATDHAPHLLEEKQSDYFAAPSGLPLVQHALPALLDMCSRGIFTPEMVVRKTSHAVAERFQLKDRGYIREGYWADLVVIDPFSHQQIIREDVAYKCGWSPFEGRILSGGAVDMTLVNGHVIWNGHTIQQKYGLPLEFCR